MKVSVVICTYDEELYEHVVEAVESVLGGTYDDVEIVVVVDGREPLYERLRAEYADAEQVFLHCNDENRGLSASRNRALEIVSGDIVAFMDDDAVADRRWVEELVSVYQSREPIAVGGRMTPIWVTDKPGFLPPEFYWLVGVTHRGFAEDGEEVRNTFGSNISFRTEILSALGGFETDIGRQGEKNLQVEEAELCVRMQEKYGKGVIYNSDAKVGHKVFAYRTEFGWLVNRAFWQGYSKRAMKTLVGSDATAEESDFLRQLALSSVPVRVKSLFLAPKWTTLVQLGALFIFTAAVALGYLYAFITWEK